MIFVAIRFIFPVIICDFCIMSKKKTKKVMYFQKGIKGGKFMHLYLSIQESFGINTSKLPNCLYSIKGHKIRLGTSSPFIGESLVNPRFSPLIPSPKVRKKRLSSGQPKPLGFSDLLGSTRPDWCQTIALFGLFPPGRGLESRKNSHKYVA